MAKLFVEVLSNTRHSSHNFNHCRIMYFLTYSQSSYTCKNKTLELSADRGHFGTLYPENCLKNFKYKIYWKVYQTYGTSEAVTFSVTQRYNFLWKQCVHARIHKNVFSRSLTKGFTKGSREFVSPQTFQNHRTAQQFILHCSAAEIPSTITQKLRCQKVVGKYFCLPLSELASD